MGDQLDALLKEIEAPKPAVVGPVPERTTIAQFGTTSTEVNALLGDHGATKDTAVIDDGAPLPIYVRALEILNFPFDALPNGLRELFGKIAILTLFNSLAVLLYVLIFRRHH
jgi:hypothetical protein